MQPRTYITTSWDDGHPLDFRVAELLSKHGLRGTFYIPMRCEAGTMTPHQIRDLSSEFEIGAHTLNHAILVRSPADVAEKEICGSKAWLEDITGVSCKVFCPPQGRFDRRHLGMVERAGFIAMRSTELVSTRFPTREGRLLVVPTTIQAHPHGQEIYAKNFLKRAAFGNAWRFIRSGASTDWSALANFCLKQTLSLGGVFHLWGHSWELQDHGQWRRLDKMIALLGEVAKAQAHTVTNGQLCDLSDASG